MATVRASGELAQGQMTSCRRPLLWKTLRNASQEEIDPRVKEGQWSDSWSTVIDYKSHHRKPFWRRDLGTSGSRQYGKIFNTIYYLCYTESGHSQTELKNLKNSTSTFMTPFLTDELTLVTFLRLVPLFSVWKFQDRGKSKPNEENFPLY